MEKKGGAEQKDIQPFLDRAFDSVAAVEEDVPMDLRPYFLSKLAGFLETAAIKEAVRQVSA